MPTLFELTAANAKPWSGPPIFRTVNINLIVKVGKLTLRLLWIATLYDLRRITTTTSHKRVVEQTVRLSSNARDCRRSSWQARRLYWKTTYPKRTGLICCPTGFMTRICSSNKWVIFFAVNHRLWNEANWMKIDIRHQGKRLPALSTCPASAYLFFEA